MNWEPGDYDYLVAAAGVAVYAWLTLAAAAAILYALWYLRADL